MNLTWSWHRQAGNKISRFNLYRFRALGEWDGPTFFLRTTKIYLTPGGCDENLMSNPIFTFYRMRMYLNYRVDSYNGRSELELTTGEVEAWAERKVLGSVGYLALALFREQGD